MPKRLLPILAIALMFSGCTPQQDATDTATASAPNLNPVDNSTDREERLTVIVDKYTEIFIRQRPTMSTMLAIPPEQVGGPYNDRFPDYSPEGMQALQREKRLAVADLSTHTDLTTFTGGIIH